MASSSSCSSLNLYFRRLRESMSSSSSTLNLYHHLVPRSMSMRSFDQVPAAAIPSTVSAAAIAAIATAARADFKAFLCFCNNPAADDLQLLVNAWKNLSIEEKESYLQIASEVELEYQKIMAE